MNKVQANEINLTTNGALVLQQVYEDGGDDAATHGYAAPNGDECAGGLAA